MHTIMITVETENYNHISQDFYNNTINSLDLALIPCTCGHSGCLIHHGVYKRSIQLADTLITLSVIRIYCKECGHTHALLLSSMVPYFQIPLQLYVNTIIAAEHQTGFASLLDGRVCVDENNLKSILRNYRLHWCERLRAVSLCLTDLSRLVSGCFSHFSRQFMQIKTTRNILFVPPT
jgi:hypothetical protein